MVTEEAGIFWCSKCQVRCDGFLIGSIGVVHTLSEEDKHYMDDGRPFTLSGTLAGINRLAEE